MINKFVKISVQLKKVNAHLDIYLTIHNYCFWQESEASKTLHNDDMEVRKLGIFFNVNPLSIMCVSTHFLFILSVFIKSYASAKEFIVKKHLENGNLKLSRKKGASIQAKIWTKSLDYTQIKHRDDENINEN